MAGMKKSLIALWAAVGATGLAFANNVVAVARWWMRFAAAQGDSSQMQGRVGGIVPWLDWSAVDYSAVTTLIPFIGTSCILKGFLDIERGRPRRAADFPFFRSSDQFMLALGLFGTLWGIIVIGYFQLDKVTMADLMQCLHTALFSTLAAVVWVFLIDHPLVRPFMRRHLEAAGLAKHGRGELASALDSLVERLDRAAAASAKFEREAAERFERRLAESEKAFAGRQSAYENRFAERLAAFEKAQEEHLAAYEQAVEARRAEYEKRFADRLAALESENRAECERHGKESARLSGELDRARAAQAEAVSRAVLAETRLKAVREAFNG